MTVGAEKNKPLRPVIVGAFVVCLAIAMAPWMSGGQDGLARLLSAGALLLGSLLALRQPAVRRLRMGPLAVAFIGFIGWALLSLLWTASTYSTGLWVTQWLMAGLAFGLAYTVAGEPKGREWLLRAYLISAAIFAVVAVWAFLTGTYDRLTGTFYWANPAAAYLIPALLITLDRARRSQGKFRYLWGTATSLFLATFLLADSRGALLVLVFTGIVYALISPINKRFWIHFVFIIVLGWVASFGLVQLSTITAQHQSQSVPGSRLAEAVKGESTSGQGRILFLKSAFDIWLKHPLVGTGAGTYADVHPEYQQKVTGASSQAHNIYVQTLAELGIVGVILLGAILLAVLAGALRGVVAQPDMVVVWLGAVGLLLHFGLDIDASYPALLTLLAVLLGLVHRQWSQSRAKANLWWPVVALLVIVPVASVYQSEAQALRASAAQDDMDYLGAAEHYEMARQGVLYNPDYINAEGINRYTLATAGGSTAEGHIASALDLAHVAQRADGHDGQHWQLEGRVLVLRGDVAGATRAYRRALELDPYNHPDYATDLASVQFRQGDLAGAAETAKRMLDQYSAEVIENRNMDVQLKPALSDLAAVAGNVALEQGKVDEAAKAAKRSLELDPKNLAGRALNVQVEKRIIPAKSQ